MIYTFFFHLFSKEYSMTQFSNSLYTTFRLYEINYKTAYSYPCSLTRQNLKQPFTTVNHFNERYLISQSIEGLAESACPSQKLEHSRWGLTQKIFVEAGVDMWETHGETLPPFSLTLFSHASSL